MKFITTLLLIAVAAPCACAAPIHEPIQTPTMKMVLGNPDPLLQQVRTGAIGVNDVHGGYADESVKIYPALSQTRWTPLCAAIAGDDIDSVSALLKLGASMKQPCGLFGAEKATPLEYSMRRSGVTQKAGAIARLLAAEGGVSGTGKVSEADIQNAEVQSAARLKQYKSEGDALIAQSDAETLQRKLDESKNSIFNRDTLMGLVAIAGGTASNYAAMKNSASSVPSLSNLLAQTPKVERVAAVNSAQAQAPRSNAVTTSTMPANTASPSSATPAVSANDRIYFAYALQQSEHSVPVCSTEGPTETHGPLAKIAPLPAPPANMPWDLITPQPVTKAQCDEWVRQCRATQAGSLCH